MTAVSDRLAKAAEALLADKYLSDPINAERMADLRGALAAYQAERAALAMPPVVGVPVIVPDDAHRGVLYKALHWHEVGLEKLLAQALKRGEGQSQAYADIDEERRLTDFLRSGLMGGVYQARLTAARQQVGEVPGAHTAEPWAIGKDGDVFAMGGTHCIALKPDTLQAAENMRRIAAAVNATAGISTPALEAVKSPADFVALAHKVAGAPTPAELLEGLRTLAGECETNGDFAAADGEHDSEWDALEAANELIAKADAKAATLGEPPTPAFVVVQEGGSSGELYIHSSPSEEDAVAFRESCADAAYRTSGVIEVPAALAAHGEELYVLLEAVAVGTNNLDVFEPEEGMKP